MADRDFEDSTSFPPDKPITAEQVRQVFLNASTRLKLPPQEECQRIAGVFNMQIARDAWRRDFVNRTKTRAEIQGENAHNEVCEAIRLILKNGDRISAVAAKTTLPEGAAASLTQLLDAARAVVEFWPSLDARNPNLLSTVSRRRVAIEEIEWQALSAWRAANPARKIGGIGAADQPATRLVLEFLQLLGFDDNASTVARDATSDRRRKWFQPKNF